MKTQTVCHIITHDLIPSKVSEFLCNLLFILPDKEGNYNLQKGIRNNVALTTKTKSKFNNDNSKSKEYLVYFKSNIDLPSIHTPKLTVLNSAKDSKSFENLDSDPSFYILGLNHVRVLSIQESRYIYKLLDNFVLEHRRLMNNNSTSFPCNHYKSYSKEL